MILNILTVLFFVLGFALLFWMIVERRRDVLHYVTKTSRARPTMPADLRAQTSLAKQSRIVRYTEGKSEMSTAGLQELGELDALGVKLLATARELPPGPDRDNALQLIGRFRVQIAAPERPGFRAAFWPSAPAPQAGGSNQSAMPRNLSQWKPQCVCPATYRKSGSV